MARKTTQPNPTLTTAQRLNSIIKSCRDIMRKDKGLNGDLDRLPMLTWIMFLKFLDDMEQIAETEAELDGKTFRPLIESPYRWRDWSGKLTGDELIAFINNDEVPHFDDPAQRIQGLFAHLRSLRGSSPRADVVANVFEGVNNRMISGYLLRDVVEKINDIHFTSSDEIHTLGHLYESMLKEMRDSAGDSGEFYTPRPVVKFMVQMLNPRLGEKVYDPACGTGGFLVEAYQYLEKQVQSVEDRATLQQTSIYGGEAKPLPYMLAQMNLLLHGLEAPNLTAGNSLTTPLREIGDAQRVELILTNPPFGGEEERAILSNFPEDMQTAETTLLFLQLIMRKLNRRTGRAAVIVPNGTLFADGVAARLKAQLVQDFNLHTIVRLPNGVFAPYTGIPTNILFFERGTTAAIWYYEIALPDGRKNYTKTKPMQWEDFAACVDWWQNRAENDSAWQVNVADLLKKDDKGNAVSLNLDLKNPRAAEDLAHRSPEDLINSILDKEARIMTIMEEIRAMVGKKV